MTTLHRCFIGMFSFFSAALILLVIQVTSTPLQPTFSSCLSSFPPVASGPGLLDVTNIYANLVTGAEASKLGLVGGGHEVLRVDLIGITGEEILGYDNSTNKLGEREQSYSIRLNNVTQRRSSPPPTLPASISSHQFHGFATPCSHRHYLNLTIPTIPLTVPFRQEISP